MRIIIRVIPHDQQRYPTVGDWQWLPNGSLDISISDMDNWRYETLVGIHELTEVLICRHLGITQEEVDRFDIEYEKQRPEGDTTEPGDSPLAPYRIPHFIATTVERIVALALGVDWKVYDEKVMSL